MSVARTPEPVYLQHMPREVALRVDELFGAVSRGRVVVHKADDGSVKYEVAAFPTQEGSGLR